MLEHSVSRLKGVGEKVAEDFALMNIHTIEDLLFYFPYRYNSFEVTPLAELVHDSQVTIVGKVMNDPIVTFYGRKKSRLTFNLQIENVVVRGVMFNRAFAKNHLPEGTIVTLTGKWDAHRLQITVSNYKVGKPNEEVTLEPIYSVRGDLTNYRMRKLVASALLEYGHAVEEILPEKYLLDYKIPGRSEAVKAIHFPKSSEQLKHAKRRFTYEELLLFQLKMQLLRKKQRESEYGKAYAIDEDRVESFIASLPFTLTNAQARVLQEVLADVKSPYEMNRLLQGDVGSGKTAVAAVCLYAIVTAGYQGALMVPTEILAEQHYESFHQLLGDKVRLAMLTSAVKGKRRKVLLEQIASGEVDIVIGTHSLIQEDVIFSSLALVIIDEQHRFGVEQRRTLKNKGKYADVLFMTATPIPRTLAITAFGDMDVSIINEMPKGRKAVETYWVKENMFSRVLEFIKKRIDAGEQAYVVAPLIEESEVFDYQNAVDLYTQLQNYYPPSMKIGLLHGKLTPVEKDEMMRKFANNEIHILVATTVIEVGVNVPNATVMVIYDAERFGLSQLHQLRGRVGRADQQSYCILIADPKGEIGKERMKIMTETNDGFILSEADLKLRGPGDFFGSKQSGLPDFKVANMIEDYRALEVARADAVKIVTENLLENDSQYRKLHAFITKEGVLEKRLD